MMMKCDELMSDDDVSVLCGTLFVLCLAASQQA
jgi:hypothetical protein